MRPPFRLLLSLSAAAATAPALLADAEPAALSLESAITAARASHPLVATARARAETARARVDRASSWADPMAGIEFMREHTLQPFDVKTVEYMVSQELPLSRRNRVAAQAADARAEGAAAEVLAAELAAGARAAAAYFALAGARAQLEIVRREQRWIEDAIVVAQARLESGGESLNRVLAARTELTRLAERALARRNEIAAAEARLNETMGRDPAAPIGAVTLPPTLPDLPDLAALRAHARVAHPALAALARELAARDGEVEIARRAWVPDPALTLKVRSVGGRGAFIDEYDTGVSFSLPWLNPRRARAGIREASLARRAVESEQAVLGLELDAAVTTHWHRLRTAREQVVLFRDRLQPLARHTLENAKLGYESGRATLLEILEAARTLEEIDAAAVGYLAEAHTAVAELAATAGHDHLPQPSTR